MQSLPLNFSHRQSGRLTLFKRHYVDGAPLALNLYEQHPRTVDASDQGQQSPWNNPIDPTRLVQHQHNACHNKGERRKLVEQESWKVFVA
jgi:hypothetical protein